MIIMKRSPSSCGDIGDIEAALLTTGDRLEVVSDKKVRFALIRDKPPMAAPEQWLDNLVVGYEDNAEDGLPVKTGRGHSLSKA